VQVTLGDALGDVNIDASHAVAFIKAWFNPDDTISLVGRKSEKSGSLDTLSQFLPAKDLWEMDDDLLHSLVFNDGAKWNIYFGAAPVKEAVTLFRRGTEDNISRLIGVWADIDLKEGGFSSQAEIHSFLSSLVLQPTIVVESGSGGVHAYWKLDGKSSVTGKTREANKELTLRWWAYIDDAAGPERKIDRLYDLTRIFRLPGSAYFPREGSNGKAGSVKLVSISKDNIYSAEQILSVSQAAHEKKEAERKRVAMEDKKLREQDIGSAVRDLKKDGQYRNVKEWMEWSSVMAYSLIEDYVNSTYSWDFLKEYNWTFLRYLHDGSREWAPPGRNERSAVTDYKESDLEAPSAVMSLLSMSEDTGLLDLFDANVPLTKFRVLLRYKYKEDGIAMVEDLKDDIMAFMKAKEEAKKQEAILEQRTANLIQQFRKG
jgi:hypothetical protein